MYGKIFSSIYDGTLAEDWRALITFQQLIVLCDADGVIDMTPSAISRRTGIPIEHIKAGIEILENPDEFSRTEGDEGRRIIRMDAHRAWGWHIVNHNKYKMMQSSNTRREQNRINKQKQRERDASKSAKSAECHHTSSMSAHTDTNTDTNTKKKKSSNNSSELSRAKAKKIPYQKIVDLYHEKLPTLPRVEKLTETRKRQIRSLWSDDLPDMKNWNNFFDHVSQSSFLMGKTQTERPFRATLEWITKPANFVKIFEGNYHNG